MPRNRLAAILTIGFAVLVGAACALSATGKSTPSNLGYVRAGDLIFAASSPTPTPARTRAPTPTATEGSALTAGQQRLLDHIPAKIAGSCATPSNVSHDFAAATASLACRVSGQVSVEYHQFASRSALNKVWRLRRPVSTSGRTCTDLDWEGTWYMTDPNKPVGRMQCWGLKDFAAIEWTDDQLGIYAEAYILSRRPRPLYRAWLLAGPV